jgi:hypothetical protein
MSKKTRRRLDTGSRAKVALPSWRRNINFTRTRFMPGRSSCSMVATAVFGGSVSGRGEPCGFVGALGTTPPRRPQLTLNKPGTWGMSV